MKLTTIVLATAFSLTSTFALAQSTDSAQSASSTQSMQTVGRGTVTAPSVGSYQRPVGTTNVLPSWSNTGPAANSSAVPYGSPFATR